MPVKGSTSRESNSSSSWSATPPISPPPPKPQQSGVADPSAEEAVKDDFKPSDSQRTPQTDFTRQSRPSPLSLASPPPNSELADAFEEFSLFLLSTLHDLLTTLLEWRPSPFHLFAFLMHLLCFIQLVALLVEDSIVRTTMADPLPKELPRGSTWGKRFSRWNWRGRQLVRRYKGAMGTLGVCAVVCAWIGWEAVMRNEGVKEPGWNDVPAARWVSGMIKEVVEGEGRRCPFRLVVVIETLAALLSLIQPLKHLLPTSILPPTLPPPALLFPSSTPPSHTPTPRILSPALTPSPSTPTSPSSSSPPSPSRSPGAFFTFPSPPPPLALDAHWLLLHLDSLLQSFLSLFQFALLLPLLPRSTYSLFHPAPHILLLSIRGRLIAIGKTRDKMRRTVECLRVVFDEFPEVEGGEAGVGEAKEREEEAEGDWVCTICFEGMEEEENSLAAAGAGGSGFNSPSPSGSNSPALLGGGGEGTSSKAKRTMKARCRLPCSHRYHAGCLTTWLQYQSWCPSCHTAITSKRSDVAAPATPLAPLFPQQPAEVDMSDIYPGNGGGGRRRTVSDE
ncbi:hypothetical protein BCR35DRAFT_208920 [Leucosporidium creatinivorum]|uniref:RING-type domain-containing protein n=1 Tax=Leucosporidium creatinivorum TaxID=106004 RepID=A0A1Y2DFX7_9BASI|nr:hypothetical protein BCR35DRAFT_208920 [Leucosporidium creatinivorum]